MLVSFDQIYKLLASWKLYWSHSLKMSRWREKKFWLQFLKIEIGYPQENPSNINMSIKNICNNDFCTKRKQQVELVYANKPV